MNQLTISSNTLFHFTNNIDILINIIKNGFKPHFCLENMNLIFSHDNELLEHAIPMVCFCDIPLSLVKSHMENYGKYGIGLSKEWGMQNNISPVLYAYDSSEIISSITKIAVEAYQGEETIKEQIYPNILRIFSFTKPYEGTIKRDEIDHTIRFYDEREWRFVPLEDPFKYGISKESFLNKTSLDKIHEELWKKVILQFNPSDIKYIIVAEENEIITIIDTIEQIGKEYKEDEVKLLGSRIISAKKIYEDF